MDLALLVTGVAIGLSVTAPLGPVNIIVVRAAIRRGVAVAVMAGLGSVLADVIFATVAAYGVRSVERFIVDYALPLTLIGGFLLVVIGVRTARHHVTLAVNDDGEPSRAGVITRKFFTTLVLALTNPGTFFGILAIFGTMSPVLRLGSASGRSLTVVAGVGLGGLLWWSFLSLTVHHLKTRLTEAVLDRINRWAGILIAGFGFALLMEAVF
ncbi:MAG: LysE family transporter [Alphaproteobacteria bacterium]|nr:LysE family transporter [Alphaproteobacteria bacterium]